MPEDDQNYANVMFDHREIVKMIIKPKDPNFGHPEIVEMIFKPKDLRHAPLLTACREAVHEAMADGATVDLHHVLDVSDDEIAGLDAEVNDLSHFLWRPQHA